VPAAPAHTACGSMLDDRGNVQVASYVGDATCEQCRATRWPSPEARAETLDRAISDYVNSYSNYKQLAELMVRDHPTLQQQKMRLVMEFIKAVAALEYTDARNEDSRALCRFLLGALEDAQSKGRRVGYLPFI
jgi:hypothetical protein